MCVCVVAYKHEKSFGNTGLHNVNMNIIDIYVHVMLKRQNFKEIHEYIHS